MGLAAARWGTWRQAGMLLFLIAILALLRSHTYSQPVDFDSGVYAVIGHALNRGQRLYYDVWDIKPPAVYISFAAAERVAGYGLAQLYLLALTTSAVAMIGIWRAAGFVAATAFVIVSGDLGLEGNRANTEAFIIACHAWSIALLARWRSDAGWRRSIGVGLLFALASLYKQVAIIPAILLAIAHVAAPPESLSRRRAALQALWMLAAVVLVWGLAFLYFALTDRAWLFWMTSFAAPHAYGGSLSANLVESLHPARVAPWLLYPLLPCAVLTLAMFAGSTRRRWAILAAVVVGAHLAMAMPGKFFAHYYQFWLIPLCIGAGWGYQALQKSSRSRRISPLAATTVLVLLAIVQLPAYRMPPREWSERMNGVYHTWMQPLAAELDRRLPPGETFYDWSEHGWLYVTAGRHAPAAGILRQHTIAGPLADWLTVRSLRQLEQFPPAFVVVWGFNDPTIDHPIARWIAANYREVNDGVQRWPAVLMERTSR